MTNRHQINIYNDKCLPQLKKLLTILIDDLENHNILDDTQYVTTEYLLLQMNFTINKDFSVNHLLPN